MPRFRQVSRTSRISSVETDTKPGRHILASEQQMWGIHGGRTGDANSLFLQQNCIALGWHAVGDLSKLAATREAFKAELASKYPEKKAGAIPVDAGQLFRFVYEAKNGDIIIYPSRMDRPMLGA